MQGSNRTKGSHTTPEHERREQARWKPLAAWRDATIFDLLLTNEFTGPEHLLATAWQRYHQLALYAFSRVPYYKIRWSAQNLNPVTFRSFDDFARLPVLTRTSIQTNMERLVAEGPLRPHDEYTYTAGSSGSTGQQVIVSHSRESALMWGALKQRELRWFRTDPRKSMAIVGSSRTLPQLPDGGKPDLGSTVKLDRWRYLDHMFETGPWYGFRNEGPLEEQIAWIKKINPAYLVAHSAELENYALAWGAESTPNSLEWLLAVGSELSGGMRRTTERVFPVPLHQNYGLNEVGMVATACPEAGRFHIHLENAFVEIIDDRDEPCRPGETGRLIVTSLSNRCMPIIRYDTDDVAAMSDRPCPCGRTLPTLINLHGRYRRTASLPPGTRELWLVFQENLSTLDPNLLGAIRRYRFHQRQNGSFELTLETSDSSYDEGLKAWFEESWPVMSDGMEAQGPFSVHFTDRLEHPESGKIQTFTSDFWPSPENEIRRNSGP